MFNVDEKHKLIMVLHDGKSFSRLAGCQVVQVPITYTDEKIEQCLHKTYAENKKVRGADVVGGFGDSGNFLWE